MRKVPSRRLSPIGQLIELVATLRAPGGCPWDQEQDHQTLRDHAIEEVYELIDAVELEDDHEMAEELGDLLLQVIFHARLAEERKAFDFDAVCLRLVDKLVRRHPHVFGDVTAKSVDQVLSNWEVIKREEKAGSKHERHSALDGIPRHLPALMRAQKLVKKALKAGLNQESVGSKNGSRKEMAEALFRLSETCQERGWSAEEILRGETARREKQFRRLESQLK